MRGSPVARRGSRLGIPAGKESNVLPLGILPAASPAFIRSGANCDGTSDISDAVAILAYLFLGDRSPCCLDAADADGGGSLEITDAIFLLGHLFLGGGPPPEPYPLCGTKPAEEGLGCLEATPTCR